MSAETSRTRNRGHQRLAAVAVTTALTAWVRAESPVYVDATGECGGLAPCYQTIGRGVLEASDPDRDRAENLARAEVFVFPGVYPESVNIGHINTASNSGDLRLVTVNSAGAPTPGTVTIRPALGAAIWSAGDPLNGSLIVDGFILEAGGFSGLDVRVRDDVTIRNVTSSFADAVHGLFVITDIGNLSVIDSDASGNREMGLLASIAGDITLTRSSFRGNGDIGCRAESHGDVFATDCSATDNAYAGFRFIIHDNHAAQVARVTAMSNSFGLMLEAAPGDAITSIEVRDSRFQANHIGLYIQSVDPGGPPNPYQVSGCIICDNPGAGIDVQSPNGTSGHLYTYASWWGSETGPTHPANGPGTGDRLVVAAGDVQFSWIDRIIGHAPAGELSVGESTDLAFQFSNPTVTSFLGAGPGSSLDEPAFTLTTDNGELSSSTGAGQSVSEAINEPNGTLAVALRPAIPGSVTVALNGPCGLDATLVRDVIAADLTLSQRADAVMVGDVVNYVIEVGNNGPDDAAVAFLTNWLPAGAEFISADASQGSCYESPGTISCDLGSLAVGATATVKVAVVAMEAGELTNAARVAGYPGDHEPADNESVQRTTVIEPPADDDQPADGDQPVVDDDPDAVNAPGSDGPSSGGGPVSEEGSSRGAGPQVRRGARACGAGVAEFGALAMASLMLLGTGLTPRLRRQRRYDPQS